MERELWVYRAYERLWKAMALLPETIVAVCRICMALLLVDLFWVGLVNQGVRSSVPGLVRAESLARSEERMTDSEVALAEASYSAPNASGIRRFVGSPAQLRPFSRLSRAFSRAATCDGRWAPRAGVAQVREEYETLGMTARFTRSAYLVQAARAMMSCLVLLLTAKNWRGVRACLYQFVASCVPRG